MNLNLPRVTIARGDGVGPEIMEAVLRILQAAGARLHYDEITVGESAYLAGHLSGITPGDWEVMRRNRILLKGPITTPSGGGYKSLNVSIRKRLGLFANVRPCRAYHPFVKTNFPNLDMVIIRENEEDVYAGIEHQQTDEVVQTLKLVSRPGCEAICRYAFEYARAYGRRKVTCLTKSNIMKHTDGLFQKVFEEVAADPRYADLVSEHRIVDVGAALVAAKPETLDVVVTLNLYGDIVSDIAAEVAGSLGLAGSANVGTDAAMFEAVHGSAPDIAGKGIANPSGLLNAAIKMLVHLQQGDVAAHVRNAWLRTLEDGIHTADIFRPATSSTRVGTAAFADAVIERLGQLPQHLPVANFSNVGIDVRVSETPRKRKALVGVDIFLEWDQAQRDPRRLGICLEEAEGENLGLQLITNRGVKVYPGGFDETFRTDHWRCRFLASRPGNEVSSRDVLDLLQRLHLRGLNPIKTENLYSFDGQRGYSLAQAE